MVQIDEFNFPDDLRYFASETDSLWLKEEGGKIKLGITELGAFAAGKIKFIRLRPAGKDVKSGRSIGTLESGKWTGAVKAPVGGTIVEVNEALKDNPALLNDDPYGAGWIAVIDPGDMGEFSALQGSDGLEAWAKAEVAAKKAMKGE
ncbi:MAG: glycine cleavage system protein H [Candidatus Thorarchaeota archaeon]